MHGVRTDKWAPENPEANKHIRKMNARLDARIKNFEHERKAGSKIANMLNKPGSQKFKR